MAKLRGALSSATSRVASGAKAVAGKARSAAGKAGSFVRSKTEMLPSSYTVLTGWPTMLLLFNIAISMGGFYMYLKKYNKFRWDSFTADGKLPFIEIHSHLNVLVLLLLSAVWTFTYFLIRQGLFLSDYMKYAMIFSAIFAVFNQVFLFAMYYWLFTGADDDNANDLAMANKKADLNAASAANANAAACSTACAGDRSTNANVTTITADCPNGTCP
jgi:hypothetical protein